MRFEDAVAAIPWRCARLKQLEITTTDMTVPELHPSCRTGFMFDTTDAPPRNTAIKSRSHRLKQLYQQLGSLVELTHIDLRTTLIENAGYLMANDPKVHRRTNFSAMLNWDDAADGTIKGAAGYLHLLGDLTKLRDLQGSVSATTKVTKVAKSWPEARWMADLWSNLEVAEFLEAAEEPRREFLWLQSQSKGGKLTVPVPQV
ncbi:hypothetical protein BG015_007112 [Linnemannia schmuckeri]|uniref:Uncharacterized protein n=1 Tax=Linnemannia schmuckeri TaxID=64567 RepID=A0A9P5S1N9_9FUNG|nr:hypothetical protein BG015_007112 [Linnemannia schmuckeri]